MRLMADCLQAEFQVIDSDFLSSPPILLHISIRVAETNAPRVSWNTGGWSQRAGGPSFWWVELKLC